MKMGCESVVPIGGKTWNGLLLVLDLPSYHGRHCHRAAHLLGAEGSSHFVRYRQSIP